MIQDIFPNQFVLDYKVSTPSADDTIMIIHRGNFYLTPEKCYPTYASLVFPSEFKFTYLFGIDNQRFFLADASRENMEQYCSSCVEKNLLQSCTYRDIRTLRPMYLAYAGFTAWHLASWYQSNRFCGRCGSEMVLGTNERKVVCSNCHNEVFPRINPAVIVAVYDKDRLLMTKYNRPGAWFVLIAGFVEIGETAEDTVRREVMEEAGVKVKNIRYFGSQPWGVPGNLTLGYIAELDGSDEITIDTNELCDGRWFQREDVPVPDDEVSITAAMIRAFANNEF